MFVASPSDVAEERKAIDPIVAEINQTIARRLKIVLDVVMWETDTYPGISPGGPQAVIEEQIDLENTDLVIGIFWRRFGTDTGFGNSGSSHEIKRACELSALRKKPHVMVYFCEKPSIVRTLDEADQQRKLFEFKEQLQRMGMLIWQFENLQQFVDIVRKHLTGFVQDYVQPAGNGHDSNRSPDRSARR